MSDDDKRFRPRNVTVTAAEAYLVSSGWGKDISDKSDNPQWLRNGARSSRGQAVMQQFRDDFTRLLFVLNHAPPEMLMMLIPPHVLEKIVEMANPLAPPEPSDDETPN